MILRFAFFTLSFLLLFGLLALSCKPEMIPPAPIPAPGHSSAQQCYLALGDSYTIGESVTESERWSVQLAAMLRQEGINVAAPRIIARTGWTTAELLQTIETEDIKASYDMVSLLIGVNNQYRGQPLDLYRTEFRALLQLAIRFAKDDPGKVLVLSIPDWGVTPFAQDRDRAQNAQEIDQFNAVAQEEAQKAGVSYVDITPESRTAAKDQSLVAADKLHFSGSMYRKWAELALPVAQSILEK